MAAPCIFCLIAAHRADAAVVFEDADVVAFMCDHPIRPGHLLVIPRIHSTDVLDLELAVYSRVFEAARTLGRAIRSAFRPKRLGVVVAGFDVAHAHVHLIPMADYHDVTSRALLDGTLVAVASGDLQATAAQIKRALQD